MGLPFTVPSFFQQVKMKMKMLLLAVASVMSSVLSTQGKTVT